MSEERRQILNMLAQGKIDVAQAEKLLEAVGESGFSEEKTSEGDSRKKPKFLRIMVHSKADSGDKHEDVNIRIPLQLVKAGMMFGSLIPDGAKERVNEVFKDKGINIDLQGLKSGKMDDIISALNDTHIDVNDDEAIVRIFCE